MKRIPSISQAALVDWLSEDSYMGACVHIRNGWTSHWVNYALKGLDSPEQRKSFWHTVLHDQDLPNATRLICSRNRIGKHLAGRGDRNASGHEVRSFYLQSDRGSAAVNGGEPVDNTTVIRQIIREELAVVLAGYKSQGPYSGSPMVSSSPSTPIDASSANRLIETMYHHNTQTTIQQMQILNMLLNRSLSSNERLQAQNLHLVATQLGVDDSFMDKAVEFLTENRQTLDLATGALANDPNTPDGVRKAFNVGNLLLNAVVPATEEDDDESAPL